MTDLDRAIADAREALAKLREHDGGTRYNGDDDDAGERACCLVASWKPHDSDCPHAVAVVEFERLLAALDAARGEAVGYVWPGSIQELESLKGYTEALIFRRQTGQAGLALYAAAPPAALAVLPEPLPPTPDTMNLTDAQREVEDSFRRGWNSCRATVMQAAPQPQASAEDVDAIDDYWGGYAPGQFDPKAHHAWLRVRKTIPIKE